MGWIPQGKFNIHHGLLLCASSVLTAAVASFVLGRYCSSTYCCVPEVASFVLVRYCKCYLLLREIFVKNLVRLFKFDFFSAPERKAQVHYCDHVLSVVRPSLTFHIFDFFSETAEQNSTKLDRKQELNILYQVCVFSGRSEKQDGRPGLWLAETFSTSLLKPLKGIQQNLTGSKISMSSTKFVFFVLIENTRWLPWPLIGWDIFDFFSETANRIQWNWTGSKISMSYTKFVFFGPIGKTRWPPWPLIGWDIFDFSSEIAEQNSMKLDRKQDLNVLYHLASCQVSLNTVQRFQRKSRKCVSQSEARAAILLFQLARKTQTW